MNRAQNPHNDQKKVSPVPKHKEADKDGTSYDTSQKETDTVQKVREAIEPEGEQARAKKAK